MCLTPIILLSFQDAAAEKVLFVSDREEPGNHDLYLLDTDTQTTRRLTTDAGIDNHPDLSPDGTKVVWSSTRLKEKPSDAATTNPEGDFEIFLADWSDVSYLDAPSGTVRQLTSNDVTDPGIPPLMRHIPDRHPHFSPDGTQIIYTAKYVCVATEEITCVSECSIPLCTTTVDPCGRLCEGIRIMDAADLNGDHVGDNLINIDHSVLSAANPALWPPRPLTDARWVGHASFSHDGSKILFSGAVDGMGRDWEVYVGDWNGSTITALRQITKGSLYPPNANPIKLTGGAHFSNDDATIFFTSTRTQNGNSQLFSLPTSAEMMPVEPAIRYGAGSDRANDYVPEPLADESLVVTSDRDDYKSKLACGGGPGEYARAFSPGESHSIRIEASGLANPLSGGRRIHLDGYSLNGSSMQETDGTSYSAGWLARTSPNADVGFYSLAQGTAAEYVEILIPSWVSDVSLVLGTTPTSGIARLLVDGVPITDGDTALPGDPGSSGWDLFTPELSTSNDLDLVLIGPGGAPQTNLTDNDFADEMNLIGDEVSWFCGLSPNLSPCTYIPKVFRMGSLCLMLNSETMLQEGFPNRCLYSTAMNALNSYMFSQNPLRPRNHVYWQQVTQSACNPFAADMPVVVGTPVNYYIENIAPTTPSNPQPQNGSHVGNSTVVLTWSPSSDSENDAITYDVMLGRAGIAMLLVAHDSATNEATVSDLVPGAYEWRVTARDCRGGLADGPIWDFVVDDVQSASEEGTLHEYGMSQNEPNPFRPLTSIAFNIPATAGDGTRTVLRIYGPAGQIVRTLLNAVVPPGQHRVVWDGSDDRGRTMGSGLYFYRIEAGSFSDTRRMLLLK